MISEEKRETDTDSLPRRLGVPSLVLIIVGFNAPLVAMAGFSQLSIGYGNGIGAPLSFLVAGGILLLFSIGFVGMSRFMDQPGAFYRYIVAGLGKPAGFAGAFLAAAAYILLCAGSYPYMGLVAVDLMTSVTGDPLFSWQLWSIIFLVIITTTGLFRIDLSLNVLGKLVCLEVLLVAAWQAAVLIRGGPEGYAFASFSPSAFMQGSPGLGVLFAMLTMSGIESGACLRGETKDPEHAIPRATYFSIVFLAIFYGLGIWCYIVTQGASHAIHSASADPVGTFLMSVGGYLGGFVGKVVSLTVVTSQMVAIAAVQTSASRYLHSLARDGALPRKLARVHPRLQSPHVAVGTVAAISLTMLGAIFVCRIDAVTSYAGLTGMGIYFLLPLLIATSCAVIAFYLKNRSLQASSWSRLIAPAVSVLSITGLFVLTSNNLKVLVGTHTMVIVSLLAVIVVPLAGWLLGARSGTGTTPVARLAASHNR